MLCRTQQEEKNFNNDIFNSSNGPEHKPGILTNLIHLSGQWIMHWTQQEVKNFNNFIFNSSIGPGHKVGIFTDLMHLSGRRFCADLSSR